jgi:hypothetical protein
MPQANQKYITSQENSVFEQSLMLNSPTAALSGIGPSSASAPHPDQPLFDLYAEWQRLDQASLEACSHVENCGVLFEQNCPPLPEALRRQSNDRALFELPADRKLPAFYSDRDIEKLGAEPRRRRALRFFDTASGLMIPPEDVAQRDPASVTDFYVRPVCSIAQARADQIIAAWDKHQEACRAAKAASGMDAADAAYRQAAADVKAIVERIGAYRAKTLDGLRVRASIISEWRSDDMGIDASGLDKEEAALAWANLRDLAEVRAV